MKNISVSGIEYVSVNVREKKLHVFCLEVKYISVCLEVKLYPYLEKKVSLCMKGKISGRRTLSLCMKVKYFSLSGTKKISVKKIIFMSERNHYLSLWKKYIFR